MEGKFQTIASCITNCTLANSFHKILHVCSKDGKWEQYIFTKTFATSCFDCAEMGHQISLSLTLIDEKGIVHQMKQHIYNT